MALYAWETKQFHKEFGWSLLECKQPEMARFSLNHHWLQVSLFAKQINQQAMGPAQGGRMASWTSAASKAVSCGAWRCTAHPPGLARHLVLLAHSATQMCQGHPRSATRAIEWTRAQSAGRRSSQTRQKTRRWANSTRLIQTNEQTQ